MAYSMEENIAAAERLRRVDEGESICSVYPESEGGESGTTLSDTERLCNAWLSEHQNHFVNYEKMYHDLMENVKRSQMDHGDCESGSRYNGVPRACTACMAKIELDKIISNYKGRRVSLV